MRFVLGVMGVMRLEHRVLVRRWPAEPRIISHDMISAGSRRLVTRAPCGVSIHEKRTDRRGIERPAALRKLPRDTCARLRTTRVAPEGRQEKRRERCAMAPDGIGRIEGRLMACGEQPRRTSRLSRASPPPRATGEMLRSMIVRGVGCVPTEMPILKMRWLDTNSAHGGI